MPIMEAVLEQTYFGQSVINRWNYLASGTPASVSFSFALVSALGGVAAAGVYPTDALMKKISGMQALAVAFTQIGARDVYSPTDFYETPFIPALNGALGNAGMSPTQAIGFRTNRTRTDIRRATKRFVGADESQIDPGGLLSTTYRTTQAEAVRAEMSKVITFDDEGNTLSFAPIVVSREKYLPDPLKPEQPAYRYYETEDDQLDHIMESIVWETYTQTRTQNSRQYGRGI